MTLHPTRWERVLNVSLKITFNCPHTIFSSLNNKHSKVFKLGYLCFSEILIKEYLTGKQKGFTLFLEGAKVTSSRFKPKGHQD